MSEWVETHIPCPCGKSSDAYSVAEDGHGHCFSCGKTFQPEGSPAPSTKKKKGQRPLIPFGQYKDLQARGISQETCKKYGYFIGKDDAGKSVQVAPYRKRGGGQPVAQKVRGPNKTFYTTGDFSDVELWGSHLYRKGGKRILIVEGEIDAMAASEMLGNWPVVSIPNGAQGAAKAIAANIEFLESYETVVLCFDMDEPGRKAVQECIPLLPPGKVAVMEIPFKDPDEMRRAGEVKAFVTAFWEAREQRPDGIVRMSEIKETILKPIEIGLPWFSETLTSLTYGRRLGETYAFGAGTGIGKTDLLTQQIQYDVDVLKEKVGLFFLEQQPEETAKRVAGKFAGKRFHVPDGSWTEKELTTVIDRLDRDDRIFFYRNFGATDWNVIKGVMTYLNQAQGIRIFYLDHLTALAAAEEDEKKGLERITADMAMLAQRLGIIIHFVSHLATPEGKPHEEGGRVMIRHFKGSRAIGFWAHFMFGLERDQQHPIEAFRSITTFRCLKDRFTGRATGKVIYLGYEDATGRLFETEAPAEDDPMDHLQEESGDY